MKNKKDFITGIALIVPAYLLGFHTNANPIPILQRVLAPLRFGGMTLYYTGIMWLVMYYMGFKKLLQSLGKKIDKDMHKTVLFIGVIVLIGLLGNSYRFIERSYKSFQNDVRAVYADRKASSISFKRIDNEKVEGYATLTVENLSSEDVNINIKIKTPKFFKDMVDEEEITILNQAGELEEFIIPKKGKEKLHIRFNIDVKDRSFDNLYEKDYEFIIFDDTREVIFKNIHDY